MLEYAVQGARRVAALDAAPGPFDEDARPMGVCLEIQHAEARNPHGRRRVRLLGKFRFWLVEAPRRHDEGFELGRCDAFFDEPLPPSELLAVQAEGEEGASPPAESAVEAAQLALCLLREQVSQLGEGGRHVFHSRFGDTPTLGVGQAVTSASLERLSFWLLGALVTDRAERQRWLGSVDTRARLVHCRDRLQAAGRRMVLNLPGAGSWMSPGQSAFGSLALLVAIVALLVAKAMGLFEGGGLRSLGIGLSRRAERNMEEAMVLQQLFR
uniref:Uncharacterized protein n=1 Tax=Zooxanthella nutricula TaxID=1333877 RepID=A0A7S2PTJ6_9DINO